MKRTLIYFIYDEQGFLDEYIFYAIKKTRPFIDNFVVVINGEVLEECLNKITRCADKVIVRENIGFDVWAYKEAIGSIGWNNIEKYDELILMNYTIVGPVYDLDEMFHTMDQKKDLDFWGITKCFQENNPAVVKLWGNPYGFIPEHIQSSFTVFRKRLFSSDMFQDL